MALVEEVPADRDAEERHQAPLQPPVTPSSAPAPSWRLRVMPGMLAAAAHGDSEPFATRIPTGPVTTPRRIPPRRGPRPGRALAALTLAALAVRVAYLALEPRCALTGDEPSWIELGRQIGRPAVAFSPFRSDLVFYPPVYPYFVGALFRAFGTMKAVLWAQVLLGALLVPAVGRAGTLAFGRRAGLLAAAATAFYPELVWYPAHYWSETVYLFSCGGRSNGRSRPTRAAPARGRRSRRPLGHRDPHAGALPLPRADRRPLAAPAPVPGGRGAPCIQDPTCPPPPFSSSRGCSPWRRGRSGMPSSSEPSSRSPRWAGSTSGRGTRRSPTSRSTRCWPRRAGRSSRTATAGRWRGGRSRPGSPAGSSRSSQQMPEF